MDISKKTFQITNNTNCIVSKVAADNSVHYNKVAQIIEFTVRIYLPPFGSTYVDHTYQAVEGMTFAEWMNSEYSNIYADDTWVIDSCDQFRLNHDTGGNYGVIDVGLKIESDFIDSSDTIISNQLYDTDSSTDCLFD